MKIRCVWEHNGEDTLLYGEDFPGSFTRGASLQEALHKMPGEVYSYLQWAKNGLFMPFLDVAEAFAAQREAGTLQAWGEGALDMAAGFCLPNAEREENGLVKLFSGVPEVVVVQEKVSTLRIQDADSDVLFNTERLPLKLEEYRALKALTLKSAGDFERMYQTIPDRDVTDLADRETFYGSVPRTAREIYEHTKSVNNYYFAEIGVEADDAGTIRECRERGFALLETAPDFLQNPVFAGSYDEEWSLRKVLRRFIWHDRIHAKAMYRMAKRVFMKKGAEDVFCFDCRLKSVNR